MSVFIGENFCNLVLTRESRRCLTHFTNSQPVVAPGLVLLPRGVSEDERLSKLSAIWQGKIKQFLHMTRKQRLIRHPKKALPSK